MSAQRFVTQQSRRVYTQTDDYADDSQARSHSQRSKDPQRDARVCWNPCAVQSLFDYLEGGDTLDEFLRQFPSVKREQALAALEQARDSVLTSARPA